MGEIPLNKQTILVRLSWTVPAGPISRHFRHAAAIPNLTPSIQCCQLLVLPTSLPLEGSRALRSRLCSPGCDPSQPIRAVPDQGLLPNCSLRWICETVLIFVLKDCCLQTHPRMSVAQGPPDVGVPRPPGCPLPDDGDHLLQLVSTTPLARTTALPSRPDRIDPGP